MNSLSVRSNPAGFTLVEIAVAVFIMALLLGSILIPLTTQVEQRQISDVQKTLEEMKESIVGFAAANGYIPCPDKFTAAGAGTMNDGQEDVTAGTGVCVVTEGNLPWVTLAVASTDPWGNRFRYRVASAFAQRAPASTFSLTTVSTVDVCGITGCATRLTTATDGPPAVILSHGRNGYGAINSNTGAANPAPPAGNTDELENTNGNTTFVYHIPTGLGSTVGEFDDIVAWVSRNVLLNRMITAGKLP
jgi:prepilin-type N-terminal cleavage/methylation domain-containing protein